MSPPPDLKARLARWADSPWVWLAPILVPFALFMAGPAVEVARLSFRHWDWFEETPAGWLHYRRTLTDPEFRRALLHTIVFAAAVVPAWLGLSLLAAALIAPMRARARETWVTVFFLTYLVSPVVLAMIWTWMLSPDPGGLVNRALGLAGIPAQPWLASPRMALFGVILSTALTIPGSGVMLYSAAISALPTELIEAATIDGAGRFTRWRHVALPLLKPTTLYLAVIYTIASFQVFERVYIMTGGGPAGATSVLVERIYSRAFLAFDFGGAAAQSVILLLMIAAVAWGQFASLKGDEQY